MANRRSHKPKNAGSIPAPASTCDHMILALDDAGDVYTINEFIKDEQIYHELAVRYLDGRKSSTIKFKHCPKCGEKLDWKYLKKMLLSAKALTAPTIKFPSAIGTYASHVVSPASNWSSNWFIWDPMDPMANTNVWKVPRNKKTYLQAKGAKRGNK